MDERLLRMLISEMVEEAMEELDEEEELDEFSGVGGVAGYTLPLGMKPEVKKFKNLGESAAHGNFVMPADSASIGGFDDHLPKRPRNKRENQQKKIERALTSYEESVEKLASSFGGSESPFGKKGKSSRKKVVKYLSPKI